MANFCTNCGTRLEKDYKFCTNCGTRIDDSDVKQNGYPVMSDSEEIKKAKKELKRVIGGRLTYNQEFLKALSDNGIDTVHNRLAIRQQVMEEIESGEIKTGGVEYRVYQLILEYKTRSEKEKEDEMKRLKLIVEILDCEEITSQIRKNKNNPTYVSSMKAKLKEMLISKKEIAGEYEIRQFIKNELKKEKEKEIKARQEEKKARILEEITKNTTPIEKNETEGGYCNYSCKYYIEQYIDMNGGMDFDFSGDEIIDYYCSLGHSLAYGSFCKYYEK